MPVMMMTRVVCEEPGCTASEERWCKLLDSEDLRVQFPGWSLPGRGTPTYLGHTACPEHAAKWPQTYPLYEMKLQGMKPLHRPWWRRLLGVG
jgi:hypothetical protein